MIISNTHKSNLRFYEIRKWKIWMKSTVTARNEPVRLRWPRKNWKNHESAKCEWRQSYTMFTDMYVTILLLVLPRVTTPTDSWESYPVQLSWNSKNISNLTTRQIAPLFYKTTYSTHSCRQAPSDYNRTTLHLPTIEPSLIPFSRCYATQVFLFQWKEYESVEAL